MNTFTYGSLKDALEELKAQAKEGTLWWPGWSDEEKEEILPPPFKAPEPNRCVCPIDVIINVGCKCQYGKKELKKERRKNDTK